MAGTLTPDQKLVYVAFLAALKNENPYELELDDYRRGTAEQNWDALLSCQSAQRSALAEQIPPDDLRPATPEALATPSTAICRRRRAGRGVRRLDRQVQQRH